MMSANEEPKLKKTIAESFAESPSPAMTKPKPKPRPLSQLAGEYREWQPAVALRDHLFCVWLNDLTVSSAKDYLVVPDGCVDILWTGEGLCVAGPDTHPIREQVQPGCRIAGVRFRPGAAHPWLGVPLSEILNARVPLAEFWGREASRLTDRVSAAPDSIAATTVLQQALLGRMVRVGPADRQVAFLRRIAASADRQLLAGGIRELSCRMGVSERTLWRHCTDAFGYGFKTLQRVLRFQRLFRLATLSQHSSLADLALEAGFADQAHMSREVRRLGDATPAEFVAQLSR